MELLSTPQTSPPALASSTKLLRHVEAASFLRLAPRTLARHRAYGTGPVFIRLGHRILYHPDDLMVWAQSHRYRSTSEPTTQSTSASPKLRR